MPFLPAVPFRDEVVISRENAPQGRAGLLGQVWARWLDLVRDAVNAAFGKVGAISYRALSTGLSTTDVATKLTAPVYRVTWAVRVSRAATASSSLQMVISWTEGGVAQTVAGAALTGNTTKTRESGTFLCAVDANTAIQAETNYASVGATAMQYSLDVMVEEAP